MKKQGVYFDLEEAKKQADLMAKCPKGTLLRDRKVIDLGIRNPEKKGIYAVIHGSDTRIIYTAKAVRI